MKFINKLADIGTAFLIPAVVAWIVQIIADAYLEALQHTGGIVTASTILSCKYAGIIAFVLTLVVSISVLIENWEEK